MNIESCPPSIHRSPTLSAQSSQWVRVWDSSPPQGVVVPVWDGDYIYYACYWERPREQFWIIADSLSPSLSDREMMKSAGEQVYPIHWLNITEPKIR